MPTDDPAWTDAAAEAFASRVRATMSHGDPAAIGSLLHPQFDVWQNSDGVTMDAARSGAFHAEMAQMLQRFEFRDIRVSALRDGYVEQHVKHMVDLAGQAYAVPSCLVVRLQGEQLRHVDEYMDASHLPAPVVTLRLRHR